MPQPLPFPVDPVLTGIALAYQNKDLIADRVLPRVPVGGRTFSWLRYHSHERFAVPVTLMSRKSAPNEVEFSATKEAGSVEDYGLDDVIPLDDIAAAASTGQAGFDPVRTAVTGLTDLILLDREIRVARRVMDPKSYPASQVQQNIGNAYWDDPDSDPLQQILDTLDSTLLRPNVAVMTRKVANVLRQHPRIVAAVHAAGGNAALGGYVPLQALAEVLELDEILIGHAFSASTKRPSSPAALNQVWTNHCAFLVRNSLGSTQAAQMTWGYTAQWQDRVSGRMDEPRIGLRGAVRVRVGESVDEIICAPDCGALIVDPIKP